MAAKLSTCHGKPVVRWTSHGFPVCSQCGMRQTAKSPVRVLYDKTPAAAATREGHDLMSDRWLPKERAEDTRDFVRHLSDPRKYSACGVRWFRTTDVSRVNCLLCLRTPAYRAAKEARDNR